MVEAATSADGAAQVKESLEGEARSSGGWLGWVKGLNPWKGDDKAAGDKGADAPEGDGSADAAAADGEAPAAEAKQEEKKSRWSWLPWVGSMDDDETIEDIKSRPPSVHHRCQTAS